VRVLISGDDDLFLRHTQAGSEGGSVAGPARCRNDHIDVIELQQRFAQVFVNCLGCRCRKALVERLRCAEPKHIVVIDETDCGIDIFALIERIHPVNTEARRSWIPVSRSRSMWVW
jgi:Fe-S cluster assembly ATPase SufC